MTAAAEAGSPVMPSVGAPSSRLRLRSCVDVHACMHAMQVSALSEQLDVPPRAAMLAAFKHILASPMHAPPQLPAQPSTSGQEQAPPHSKPMGAASAATARRSSEGQGPPAARGDAAGPAARMDPDLARAFERLAVGDLPGEPFADEEGMAGPAGQAAVVRHFANSERSSHRMQQRTIVECTMHKRVAAAWHCMHTQVH